ncbi:Na+/H+ antiporter subunit E [Saccharospirillum alexandrii]|uniref:Na+/H+ antiporter subunit E n=1 Tax=Saccharospirillum alexandrii TaxID=2448477 RepID=UPI000FD8DDE8|nr:Na+/H+ antiporter subunit E [Saccharospirillum alexandrii]
MKRLLPFPYLSLLLLIVWLLMNNSASPGHILLGLIFALLIPLGTSSMRKNQPTLKKPLSAAKYLLMLMGDIIVSNVEVAIQVLGPVRKISPGFIAVPLDITQDLPITLLASSISLTPGTVSIEVSEDKQWLYVHVLNLVDETKTIANIKQRYESPLKEIFGC